MWSAFFAYVAGEWSSAHHGGVFAQLSQVFPIGQDLFDAGFRQAPRLPSTCYFLLPSLWGGSGAHPHQCPCKLSWTKGLGKQSPLD